MILVKFFLKYQGGVGGWGGGGGGVGQIDCPQKKLPSKSPDLLGLMESEVELSKEVLLTQFTVFGIVLRVRISSSKP